MERVKGDYGPTYDELLVENGRLKGKLSERHVGNSWMVALNVAMMVANVYMFGQMIAFVMEI